MRDARDTEDATEMGKTALRTHKDLDVWKAAMELAKAIYAASAGFPKEELYGLTAQMRRAAVSVPSNIAEGAARKSSKEFAQYLSIALGSLAELETQWWLSCSLGFGQSGAIDEATERVRMMLLGLLRHVRKPPQ